MAYNNGIITAPVSVYDVQRALGVGSPDVGTLCKHANINMWARFKPVWYPSVADRITKLVIGKYVVAAAAYSSYNQNASYMPDSNPNHYDGDHGVAPLGRLNCSLAVIKTDFPSIVSEGWSYAPPVGGSLLGGSYAGAPPACPFRLSDFESYSNESHDAPIALAENAVTLDLAVGGVSIVFNVREANDNMRLLGIEDIGNPDATDIYSLNPKRTKITIIVEGKNGNDNIIFETSDYIMESDGTVEGQYRIRIQQYHVTPSRVFFSTGVYDFYALLHMENSGASPTWYCLPGVHQGTITVTQGSPASLGFSVAKDENDMQLVYLAPSVNSPFSVTSIANYKQYYLLSEEFNGTWGMFNTDGSIVVAILFKNETSGTSATFRRASFAVEEYEGYTPSAIANRRPTHMYVGPESNTKPSYNVTGTAQDSVDLTISAGSYRWVCLQWDGVFNSNPSNPWSNTGVDPSLVNRRWREVNIGMEVTVGSESRLLTIINNVICFYYKNATPGFEQQQ